MKGGEQQMIGPYNRLSLADEDVGADKAESNSIQGQRGLVEGYIMSPPALSRVFRVFHQLSHKNNAGNLLMQKF